MVNVFLVEKLLLCLVVTQRVSTSVLHVCAPSCVFVVFPFDGFQVTLLFPLFPEHASPQRVQDGEAEPQLILRDINDYNRRFSGQPRSVSTLCPSSRLSPSQTPLSSSFTNNLQK